MVDRIIEKFRSLSATEKGMCICAAMMLILVVMRWGYIRQRAADGWQYMKPIDSAFLAQPNTLPDTVNEACE